MTLKDWIQIALTVFGLIAGPFIAVQLSLRQFRSQKWWERQEQVYTEALTYLSFIRFCLLQSHSELVSAPFYKLTETETARQREYGQKLHDISLIGGYLISEQASLAIEHFYHIYESPVERDNPYDDISEMLYTVDKCIKIVKEEAIKELKEHPPSFFDQLNKWTELENPRTASSGGKSSSSKLARCKNGNIQLYD